VASWKFRAIVARASDPTIWVVAQDDSGSKSGFFAVDPSTSRVRPGLQEARAYRGIFNVDVSRATGEIIFVASDQQHLDDLWIYNPKSGRSRQVTRLNAALDRYALGPTTVISWRSVDGQPLRGALMLPPGYRRGQRLPLVVWVYGGSMGSTYANRFSFWGGLATFNFHVLTTRGYGVLFPDAPLREGMPMADLVRTVMPGVNAAIEQGYADPDRLAVMGQSYVGQSYGSYCTLALISQTTRFKAAVITAAVLHPDLFYDYLESTGYYEHGQGNMGGTIWEHRDRYYNNSPVFLFDRIETPLLIGQGEKDGRLIASDAIFTGLERLGKPVEYRVYQGEGHVLTQKANVLDFWQRRLDFLAEHLDIKLDSRGAVATAPTSK
jgi:dipeptidyl aminopeptidase/acylaminoacyl peptidase